VGNKSRRRPRVSGPSVKPPPRAGNWIWSGRDRGYQFINLDRVATANAYLDGGGHVSLYLGFAEGAISPNPEDHRIFQDRFAVDAIAHLFMVGIDVTGAGEVLASRFNANVRENLETLGVLEDEHLEAFHRGEISTVAEDLRGDAGDAGEEPERKCRICGCTNAAACEDPNGMGPGVPAPCHWIAEDLCSACEARAERLERLDEGQKKFMECNSCVHAAGHCQEMKEPDRLYPCMQHLPFRRMKPPEPYHDPATPCVHDDKEECDGCNDCGGVFRGLEKADGVISPLTTPLGEDERPRVLPYHLRQRTQEPHPDPVVDAMIERMHNSIGKPTNCLECLKVDQPSCTWSNGGPAPCPGFERDPAVKARSFMIRGPRGTSEAKDAAAAADGFDLLDEQTAELRRKGEIPKALEVIAGAADIIGTSAHRDMCWYGAECHRFPRCLGCSLRNLRDRTSPARPADVLEVTGKTSEELIERVRTCGVFRGLQQRGALFGKDYCNVGHEMREPACACCEYLRIASSPPPRKMTAEELASGHEAHDLAGGRSGGAGGESDRDR